MNVDKMIIESKKEVDVQYLWNALLRYTMFPFYFLSCWTNFLMIHRGASLMYIVGALLI